MTRKFPFLAVLLLLGLTACSSSSKTCSDFCGAGNACVNDQCVPIACNPACGPGTACEMGACVPVEAVTCTAAYPGCASCNTSLATPAWEGLCGTDTACDAATDTCVPVTKTLHATLTQPGFPLAGPFPDGYSVTAACVQCHATQAADVMATAHWTWAGPTPDLVSWIDQLTPENPGNVGKVNLLNNFCVGVPSNEKRCDQCHAGYGGDPDATKPQKSARAYTVADSSIPLQDRVDCLVCHADPAKYSKNPKDFGRPNPTVDLAAVVANVTLPSRANCGACHFYAGGGDNVKLMGSGLKNPAETTDVHMGRGMTCSDCHAGPGHTFRGSGVHVPTHTERASCTDCHTSTPHAGHVAYVGTAYDVHVAKIACQTCHIPLFSKTQFAKMDWDWSTAGDNKTCAGTPGTCSATGTVVTKVNDAGDPDPSSTSSVTVYDYIKGNFHWMRNVVPAYRWSNGKSTHVATFDRADLTELGVSTDDANRITLGEPVGTQADGKIMPFKLMRGRQAMYVDGANGFVINPNVFGPGSFWGVVQAPGYDFTTYQFDADTAAGQPSVDKLWGKVFATGAIAAGQKPAGTAPFAKFDPANPTAPGWAWRYTKLYMDMNHEVAPKAQALGSLSGGGCADCHAASPRIPICQLYPDPATRPEMLNMVVCP